MAKFKSRYRKYFYQCCLVAFFGIIGHVAFSQEEDSVRRDTAFSKLQTNKDSLSDSDDETESVEDSEKKVKYNYYYSRDQWPNDTLKRRQVPDSVIKGLKSRDDFWYADKDFKKKKEAEDRTNYDILNWLARQHWYKAVAWIIIIGGFIAVLIWFLVSSNVGIFRRRSRTVAGADSGELSENIFEIDYVREIDAAVKGEDYRMAIRLMFLRLLKELAGKNVIQYKVGKTNFDYLSEIYNGHYYKDFFRITRNYEYTWYGEFAVSREAFSTIKNDFENFEHQLK